MNEQGVQVEAIDQLSNTVQQAAPATWIDDVAILALVSDAAELMGRVGMLVGDAQHAMSLIGVQTNFEPNKTEVLVAFTGMNSQQERKVWLADDHPVLTVELTNGKDVKVVLTDSYPHLGSIIHYSGSDKPDVKHRKIQSQIAFAPLKKKLLFNPNLSLAEKRHLVHSYVERKLMVGAGAWALRTAHELACYTDGYMHHWRGCCRPLLGVTCAGATDEQVCAMLDVSLPMEALTVARLRFFWQAIMCDDGYLACVLAGDTWWMPQVAADVCAVCRVACVRGFESAPDDKVGMLQFIRSAREHAKQLKNAVKRYRLNLFRGRRSLGQDSFEQAWKRTEAQKAKVGWCKLRCTQQSGGHVCGVCGVACGNKGALGSHMSKVHAQPSRISCMSVGTVCQVCMVDFHDSRRLRQHLARSRRCCKVISESDIIVEGPMVKGKETAWLAGQLKVPNPSGRPSGRSPEMKTILTKGRLMPA